MNNYRAIHFLISKYSDIHKRFTYIRLSKHMSDNDKKRQIATLCTEARNRIMKEVRGE